MARNTKPAADDVEQVYPIGVMIGVGATLTQVDGIDYEVDPESGRIVRPVD